MYSVVLMMALTTGTESVDRGRHHGCCGCCGGYSCCGCYGGCYGCGCYGCGCYGCSCYGGGCYGCGCYGGVPYAAPAPAHKASIDAPARIVVSLPADAQLMIDGAATSSTSGERVFVSPTLTAGQTYVYTLKAVVTRDNKPISIEQVVEVAAGKESQVTFSMPQAVASK